jgi:aspartyl-tRNA(Asn)/glutamyl-tRNA(Gln) amidotransferase subunit A
MSEVPETIAEAAIWLRSGRVTAASLVESFLARIAATQDTVAAFITVTAETARAAAHRLDGELARGTDRGPMHGIPVGIKDLLATDDAPTTANSRVLDPSWGARPDATVVRRLRAAGAIPLGKLAMHELGNGWPDPATGFRIARNPWDLGRTPGGSSTGVAAAVAAGLVLGGIGSDTGGSIRGPAHCCGITGMKPTQGRVSLEGCVPLSPTLDALGPMARTSEDCATILQVIAGADPLDPRSSDREVPDMAANLDEPLAGVRIGIPVGYFYDASDLSPEVRQAVEAAVRVMQDAGATLVDLDLPYGEEATAAVTVILRSEAYLIHEHDLRTRFSTFGRICGGQMLMGAFYTGPDLLLAERARAAISRIWRRAMAAVDVAIVPSLPDVAPAFAGYDLDSTVGSSPRMGVFNLTGLPVLAVPCGMSAQGLPIGMQIVANPFEEPTAFRVGAGFQRLTDWHRRRSPIMDGWART